MMSMKLSSQDESPHSPRSGNLNAEALQPNQPSSHKSTAVLPSHTDVSITDKSAPVLPVPTTELINLNLNLESKAQASLLRSQDKVTAEEDGSETQPLVSTNLATADVSAVSSPRQASYAPEHAGVWTASEPISVISWGPEVFATPSAPAEKHKRGGSGCGHDLCSKSRIGRGPRKGYGKENKKFTLPGEDLDNFTTTSPSTVRARPPPPTPPELAYLHYSLSTPTLPDFHSISDPALVNAYRDQRQTDPAAFDARTKEIRGQHIVAKVNRGGSARLVPGDYSVDLASREDAARADKWATRRNATAGLDDFVEEDATSETGYQTPPEHAEEVLTIPSIQQLSPQGHEAKDSIDTAEQSVEEKQNEYVTSGAIFHQHSRHTEHTDLGTKVIVKTRIEVTQEVTVPKGQSTDWADIRETLRQSAHHRRNEQLNFLEWGSISQRSDNEQEESETESEQLLAELNSLGTGRNDAFAAGMARVKAEIVEKREEGS